MGGAAARRVATITHRPTLAFVLTTCLISAAAIGLALARVWAAALMPWLLVAPALALLYVWRAPLLDLLDQLLQRYSRGSALNYGLVALAAAWLAYRVGAPGPGGAPSTAAAEDGEASKASTSLNTSG